MASVVTEKLDEIREHGWTDAYFATSESDRAEYARLANVVIGMALEDQAIKASLEFEVNPDHEAGTVRTGAFGLGYPRNSIDKKVYLHTGFQSQAHAEEVIPERNQPLALRQFWDSNNEMLREIEMSTSVMLRKLGAETLRPSVFPSYYSRRNVHLRTVRYTGANTEPVGKEVITGHADLGLMTLHLYETHGGWFYAAPYAPGLIVAEDSPARREQIQAMRASMRPIEQKTGYAPFFLGANWQTFPEVPEVLRDLPACYHAGFRPDAATEEISPYAAVVTGTDADRVSVISFMHPNGDMLKQGRYIPATVSNCRPEF